MVDLADLDLPPVWQEIVSCSLQIGPKYDVPVNLILAIAVLEGGKPKQARKNTDGSYDLGLMQINTIHLAELGQYGITYEHLLDEGCYPVELATWMLARHLESCKTDFWQCSANYHSKTPKYNLRYKKKLIEVAGQWAEWLKYHFPTKEHQGRGTQSNGDKNEANHRQDRKQQ